MAEYPDSILKDFYQFLKFPKREIERLPLTANSFFRLVGVHYLVLIAAGIIYSIGNKLVNTEDLDHSIQNLLSDSSGLLFLFLVAIVAPIVEELIFRFPLRYMRGTLFLGVIFFTVLGYLVVAGTLTDSLSHLLIEKSMTGVVEEQIQDPHVLATFIALCIFILGLIIITTISFSQKFLDYIASFMRSSFPYIFYLTAVLFGYVHIMNFSGEMEWYWIPLLTLPQFSMGLTLGYGRLRFGFLACMLLHSINNLIPSIIMLMAAQMGI